ncbi:hypothetical protein J437_LFUL012824 [Ladona fulva]|uniref:Uncharacterized protein n=1 Tax=Ladona fulva TaxID=123851 RepID=A0A8K0PAC4_LADFU|nr:hypothetical protein J437_LFUL012824 [Ladona fulva]
MDREIEETVPREKRRKVSRETSKSRKKIKSFHTRDTVWAHDYRSQHCKWAAGTILYRIAPLTYQVRVGDAT